MTNPHHPFTYIPHRGEIRHPGKYDEVYEADIYESRGGGWSWGAAVTTDGAGQLPPKRAIGGSDLATEADAVAAAVAWLRPRCIETYGACG